MQNKILIKIKCDANELIKLSFIKNIELYNIRYYKNYIICSINYSDLENLNKFYKVKILKDYFPKTLLNIFKNNVKNFVLLVFALLLFLFLSNIIVNVNINSNNIELVKKLNKSLDNYKIKRLTLKKDFIEIQNIKNNILNEYKNELEWFEIEKIGMTYNIKLEERKIEENEHTIGNCNVVAISDGFVTKIISTNGINLVKNNSYVKEGDILISGHIALNEEDRADICAKGKVYAEKWYSVEISLPKKYYNKEYSNKYRYNILFENDNIDYKIFKSRLENYDTDKLEIISLLNKKIYLLKEYEYVLKEYNYDENTLNNKIDELIKEKLELNLLDNEIILQKNILKKEENDSRIIIELFVTIEKLISKQVTY